MIKVNLGILNLLERLVGGVKEVQGVLMGLTSGAVKLTFTAAVNRLGVEQPGAVEQLMVTYSSGE